MIVRRMLWRWRCYRLMRRNDVPRYIAWQYAGYLRRRWYEDGMTPRQAIVQDHLVELMR